MKTVNVDLRSAAGKQVYAACLKSEHWQGMRQQKLLEGPAQCAACKTSDGPIQLHAMRFRDTFEETRLEDLCWLCKGCRSTFFVRVGIRTQDVQDSQKLLQKTIRIINVGVTLKAKISRREKRRQELAVRRLQKQARREKEQERQAKRGITAHKLANPIHPVEARKIFNNSVSKIKERSPLNNSLAGQVVVVGAKTSNSISHTLPGYFKLIQTSGRPLS